MLATYFSSYKYVIIGIIISIIISGLFYARHSIIVNERNRVNAEWKAKEAAIELAQSKALILKNQEIANKQSQLESAQKIIIEKSKESEDAKKAYNDLRTKYANGTLRLRVPTIPKNNRAEQATNPTITSRAGHDSCELLPDLSSEILRFAREYSDNLQKLETLRELYNKAREANNGQDHKN